MFELTVYYKAKQKLLLKKVFGDIVFSSRVASIVCETEPGAYLQCDNAVGKNAM